jgi:hypothetical protein
MGYLDKGNRKYVYWKDFHAIHEIDESLLKMYIFEAVNADSKNVARKKKK